MKCLGDDDLVEICRLDAALRNCHPPICPPPSPPYQSNNQAARDVSLKQIRRLPVGLLCDENCLLMLLGPEWVSRMLLAVLIESFPVMALHPRHSHSSISRTTQLSIPDGIRRYSYLDLRTKWCEMHPQSIFPWTENYMHMVRETLVSILVCCGVRVLMTMMNNIFTLTRR